MVKVDTLELRDQWLMMRDMAHQAISDASARSEELARAEAEYYAAKTAEAMAMKAAGEPVTFIQTVIKGRPGVSEKLFDYTLAEAKYRAACEAIKTYRDSERYSYQEYQRSMEGR